MTKTDFENLDPNDPSLTDPSAPHEVAGVLRMHRAGLSARDIKKTLKYPIIGTRIVDELNTAIHQETEADHAGRSIYDGEVSAKQALEYLSEAS